MQEQIAQKQFGKLQIGNCKQGTANGELQTKKLQKDTANREL